MNTLTKEQFATEVFENDSVDFTTWLKSQLVTEKPDHDRWMKLLSSELVDSLFKWLVLQECPCTLGGFCSSNFSEPAEKWLGYDSILTIRRLLDLLQKQGRIYYIDGGRHGGVFIPSDPAEAILYLHGIGAGSISEFSQTVIDQIPLQQNVSRSLLTNRHQTACHYFVHVLLRELLRCWTEDIKQSEVRSYVCGVAQRWRRESDAYFDKSLCFVRYQDGTLRGVSSANILVYERLSRGRFKTEIVVMEDSSILKDVEIRPCIPYERIPYALDSTEFVRWIMNRSNEYIPFHKRFEWNRSRNMDWALLTVNEPQRPIIVLSSDEFRALAKIAPSEAGLYRGPYECSL